MHVLALVESCFSIFFLSISCYLGKHELKASPFLK
jgi:hypothetical protein